MDRLTKWDGDHAVLKDYDHDEMVDKFLHDVDVADCVHLETALEKLTELEDKIDKGTLIEVPKVGDTVYLRACCECVCVSEEYETGLRECPFENECELDECKDGNERIFKTSVVCIWNDGRGWCFCVRGLDIEIPLSDIGRSVFFTEDGLKLYESIKN